jgi:hypothetical protein
MVVRWFVRGLPSAQIAAETGLERKRVLRALAVVREAILRSTAEPAIPPTRLAPSSDTRLKPRAAAFGLYATEDGVGARVLPGHDTEIIKRVLHAHRATDLAAFPPLGQYAALVSRNRLYRLRPPAQGAHAFGQIEAFWSYLQRQLRARGGIRRERLALHLAEFTWRYNHRRVDPKEQVRELVDLVRRSRWSEQD